MPVWPSDICPCVCEGTLLSAKERARIRDAEALRKLGFTATCNPQGAGKWLPEFNAFLTGRKVMVIPDNDQAGRDHAVTVVGNLFIAGLRTIRVHQWEPGEMPEKGDISDWLAKPGNNCRDAIIRRVFGS